MVAGMIRSRLQFQKKVTYIIKKRKKGKRDLLEIKIRDKEISLPIRSNAASITAAPFNMVAIRISWPGQSTKDT